MRNKTLMLLFFMMLAFMSLSAQELAVKSFTHVPNDLSAQTNERLDLNGKPCALLKISVMDDIVGFEGSVVGEIDNSGVTKKVYVTSRAPFVTLEFKYHYPVTITFEDYGFKYLEGRSTYKVVLVDANAGGQQPPVVQQPPVSSANGSAVAPSSSSFRSFTETVNGVSFTMVAVKGGTFTMGATPEQGREAEDNEKPAHQVTLSDYYIGETEVTQELWQAVMGSNPSGFKGAKRPVETVSYNDCKLFILRLNQLTGRTYRLPTEAEWEYAARGGSHSIGFKYSGGDNIDAVAWYTVNCFDKGNSHPDYGTHPVGQKQPNELGLYDMSGNVIEWCQDRYGKYKSSSQTNPVGPSSGSDRVCRGGNWVTNARYYCRVSSRSDYSPTGSHNGLGLRLAL